MPSRPHRRSPPRRALRLAALGALLLAALPLGGCVIVAPPHHYYRGYY